MFGSITTPRRRNCQAVVPVVSITVAIVAPPLLRLPRSPIATTSSWFLRRNVGVQAAVGQHRHAPLSGARAKALSRPTMRAAATTCIHPPLPPLLLPVLRGG